MTQPPSLETVLDAIQRNADVSARLLVAAETIRQAQDAPAAHGCNGGHATIHFNAGGIALWVAVTCAIVCMFTAVGVFALFVNLDRKVDRATDYQQARYRSEAEK